jgi:hypothetical protein
MNSRNKGKVGEREFAALLREHGFDARRGQQFSGSPDSPDVICPELHWIHFEVKRCERIEMRDWIVQAEADSQGKPWVISFRWNNGPWLFAGRMDLLFKFLRGELPLQGTAPVAQSSEHGNKPRKQDNECRALTSAATEQ